MHDQSNSSFYCNATVSVELCRERRQPPQHSESGISPIIIHFPYGDAFSFYFGARSIPLLGNEGRIFWILLSVYIGTRALQKAYRISLLYTLIANTKRPSKRRTPWTVGKLTNENMGITTILVYPCLTREVNPRPKFLAHVCEVICC
jgi:hypothetical protein